MLAQGGMPRSRCLCRIGGMAVDLEQQVFGVCRAGWCCGWSLAEGVGLPFIRLSRCSFWCCFRWCCRFGFRCGHKLRRRCVEFDAAHGVLPVLSLAMLFSSRLTARCHTASAAEQYRFSKLWQRQVGWCRALRDSANAAMTRVWCADKVLSCVGMSSWCDCGAPGIDVGQRHIGVGAVDGDAGESGGQCGRFEDAVEDVGVGLVDGGGVGLAVA